MKKLFPVLLLTMIVGLFSSCVIVTTESAPPTYSMTFSNDTQSHVYDWYVKDSSGKNYPISENNYCEVPRGTSSTKSGLKENDYQMWFCLLSTRTADVYLYTQRYTHLNQNQVFYLSEQAFYARSVAGTSDDNSENNYVLKTADGTVLELETCVIEK